MVIADVLVDVGPVFERFGVVVCCFWGRLDEDDDENAISLYWMYELNTYV